MSTNKVVRRLSRMAMRHVQDIPLLRLLCLMGRHSRSRRYVYRDGNVTYSECRRCQARMVRVEGGSWAVVDPAGAATPIVEDTRR